MYLCSHSSGLASSSGNTKFLHLRKGSKEITGDREMVRWDIYPSPGPSRLFSLGQFYFSIKMLCKSVLIFGLYNCCLRRRLHPSLNSLRSEDSQLGRAGGMIQTCLSIFHPGLMLTSIINITITE